MKTKVDIDTGPLGEISKRLEDFSFNLYFSYVFEEALKQHQNLQDEYIEAFLDQDEELMARKEREIAMCEGAFELTAHMIECNPDETPS